ncbi:hypothetical protein FEM33_17220 [Dyadobacter flavalbus]|uniref:Uncharacterized protein n=1 Tax=Dyadobacter flavalbus TaxID=2579942 RepID=A0A5M8QT51_9BACT|nr:hypothetical protein [Dyadobacter flavalbus]KAA6438428.1 hypothetical protein FEM33_17220 [Dyadobacter flavalbus]
MSTSKGVDYYAYLGDNRFSVRFQKPKSWGDSTDTTSWGSPNQMLVGNLQISESDIGFTSHTGRFQWTLDYEGNPLVNKYAEIAPSDGVIGDSNLTSMFNTQSFGTNDYAVSYGFYDSSFGEGSLTNQDQSYVYATGSKANWMGDIAGQAGNAPFSSFVLPGAHDAGMFDTTCVKTIQNNYTFLNVLSTAAGIGITIAQALAPDVITRIVVNLSMTQKDTISTMLNLGIRYFDFRPGYCATDQGATGPLYHQHNFIPGYPFSSFLNDILSYLGQHPSEVVVVALGHSGFYQDYMKPSTATLESYVRNALNATGSHVAIGNKLDLNSSYHDLIASNKRLIILGQYGFPSDPSQSPEPALVYDAAKYDSYADSYQTTDVNVIMNALNNMNAAGQNGNDYTVLQLQGTASGAGGGIFGSVASMSDASSPLMSTKARFDSNTYPWLAANLPGRFLNEQLLICLNDFADNALTDYCQKLTVTRAASVSVVHS